MSDMEFKRRFKTLPLVSGEVSHAPERVVQVLKSPIFLQLVTAKPKLRFVLLDFIKTQTSLGGDPTNWTIKYDSRKNWEWQISDGTSKIEMKNLLKGYDWSQRLASDKFSLSVSDSFDPSSKFFSVDYYMRVSGFLSSFAPSNPAECYEWIVFPADNNTSRVNLRISMKYLDRQANMNLLYCLDSLSGITDVAIYQAQILENREKRAEKERLEQEKILEARRAISQRAQEETDRLKKDQCLSCGASCVQRRRKSDGHLFFGCSKYFTTSCKGARSILCPKCGLEMIERRRKEGGTFLGCPGWPSCNGSRTVDARLASERGVGTRKADTRKSYLSREEREEAKAYIDALDEANSHDEEEGWWDRVHSDDPRETPQYYDHRLLDRWREDPDIP